jgi:hypothetical protein
MNSDNDNASALLDHQQVLVEHEPTSSVTVSKHIIARNHTCSHIFILQEDTSTLHELFSSQLSVHEYIPDVSKEDAKDEQQSQSVQAPVAIHDENGAISEFLLQVATIPGALAGKFYFEHSRLLQKQLLHDILRFDKGVYRVSILVQYNIDHQVVLRDSFSDTESWGLEPNFYIIVRGKDLNQCTEKRFGK